MVNNKIMVFWDMTPYSMVSEKRDVLKSTIRME
jgi:hypothetical protein